MPESPGRRTLFVSAAERSGDTHASRLVREILRRDPDLRVTGFGGNLMQEAGCEVVRQTCDSASMGLGFIAHLREHIAAVRHFDRVLREERPDAVVCVDAPGFHFTLARLARWRGVPVIYYICPQIWAWGAWRRGKVLRYIDLLLPILPFEERVFANDRVPVVPVGHPVGDTLSEVDPSIGRELREELGIAANVRVIGVLPGSRTQEIHHMAPVFRAIVDRLELAPESTRVVVSCARDELRGEIEAGFEGCALPTVVESGDSRRILAASDFTIVTSGTASLEAAWFGTPMVVLYRSTWLSRFARRFIVFSPWITLPNLLGGALFDGEPVVHESLCNDGDVDEVAALVRPLLDDAEARAETRDRLRRITDEFLAPGASARAAAAVLDFLGTSD